MNKEDLIAEVAKKAEYCLNCPIPKCVEGCPAKVQINDFIAEIKQGNMDNAREIIEKSDNLGIICGAVCPHEKQCQGNCILGIKGKPVEIGFLERSVCELTSSSFMSEKSLPTFNSKVAIIGSGPSGLSCAKELAKNGTSSIVFEKDENFGGILRFGIPEFRLEKSKVDKIIEEIKHMGVEFRANCEIKDLSELSRFQFIYVAAGANTSNKLGIPNEENVLLASEFLAKFNRNESIILGKKVAVIGGGNVAMDVARAAIRLGAEVTILYRRTQKEMPACKAEIEETLSEGAKIIELVSPVSIESDGLRIIHNKLGEIDETGRARFIQVENSEETLPFDSVISAIGQHVENEFNIKNPPKNVYYGGDIVRGPATVVLAMADGRDAARAIISQLHGAA